MEDLSTLECPLKFFELKYTKETMDAKFIEFTNSYYLSGSGRWEYNEKKDIHYYHEGFNLATRSNKTINLNESFEKKWLPYFENEALKSMAKISEYYALNKNNKDFDFSRYINSQVKAIIDFILVENFDNFIRFKSFLKPFESIINYINSRYLDSDLENKIVIDQEIIQRLISGEQFKFNNLKDLVVKIFSFKEGFNSSLQKIFSDSDFMPFIDTLVDFIEKGKLPSEDNKIQANIPNEVLRFTFFILIKEIKEFDKAINIEKKSVITFMKNIFTNFDSVSEVSLSSNFQKSERIIYEEWMGNYIRKYHK